MKQTMSRKSLVEVTENNFCTQCFFKYVVAVRFFSIASPFFSKNGRYYFTFEMDQIFLGNLI